MPRLASVPRFLLSVLIVCLQGALIIWVMAAPIIWLVRDGLGPDSHETSWGPAIVKFSVQWGVPALALALPLFGLSRLARKL
jgi:hypothetical protein